MPNHKVSACQLKQTRREALAGQLTITSAFLLTLQLEWALTIFLTVARGYIFCPGAISSSCCVVDGRAGQSQVGLGW